MNRREAVVGPGSLADVPLTEAQEGIWYAQRIDPGNPIFNTGQYVDIRGRVDVEALQGAVSQALAEADALSIRVVEGPDGPVQVVDESPGAALEVVDLRGAGNPEAEALEWMHLDLGTPLDPSTDRLVAERLYVLSPDRALWYQRIHHLVIDGYGTSLVTRRICALYSERLTGRAAGAPLTPYASVLSQDAEYRVSGRRDADRQFWLAEFEDRPEVIGLAPGPAITASTCLQHELTLSPAFEGDVRATAAEAGIVWPDLLTALVGAYVSRHIGGGEAVVGVASMERLGTPAARAAAMVMNVLPVRVALDEDAPLLEGLRDVAARLGACRRHGRYRSEQLRRDLGLVGGHKRLYALLLNVLPFERAPDLPGAEATVHVLATGPVDDLTATVRAGATGGGLRLTLEANPNLYSERHLAEHAVRLQAFLERAVQSSRIRDVPTLTGDEQAWIDGVNSTAEAVDDTTLTALLEQSMARTPAAEALVGEHERLTYHDLDRRSRELADRLAHAGVGRGDIVAVALPRSVDLVVALIATLRAGAAYLPLDLSQPAERTARIIRSARPKVALTTAGARADLPDALLVIAVDETVERPAGLALPRARPEPGDPAYVIYTSGSTGEPKGVVIEHRSIVNRLLWMRAHYGFGEDDRILQKTPATFDVSVWELFLAFLSGGTLVVAPPDAHRDPAWLAALIRTHAVTTIHFVPSMLAVFVEEAGVAGLGLRRVFCSGEALTARLRNRFHEVVIAELHNLYGPTETAVDVTWWDASRHDASDPVPIGWPVWNTRLYVLDGRLRQVPAGVAGDLYVSGVQLARGYLGQPDLTAERFVPDPFVGGDARMYRTGDLAIRRDDGALLYVGRSDHQVKIRGFRIELGEIESALFASGTVGQAAVTVRTDAAGEPQIAAYLVPLPGVPVDPDAVRAFVQSRVPDYMVPAAFVVVDALPLTRSGKLDRAALPAPPSRVGRVGRRPATATEQRLASLYAEMLGAADGSVGPDDDFFALGGHSLLAARLMAHVRQAWPCDLGLGAVFANPTPAKLASVIDRTAGSVSRHRPARASDSGLGPVVHLVESAGKASALFCIHPAGGISWCYGALGRALEPPRNVYGIQAAGLDLARPIPASLEDLAAEYVDRVRALQAEGPYHLAGWSVGGIIAHVMAVRLQDAGARVGTLALLDAYPSDRWRSMLEPGEGAALKALLLMAGHDSSVLGDAGLDRQATVAFLRRSRHPLGELSDEALSGIVRGVESNNRLVRQHFHRRYRGSLLHFRAALDHQDDGLTPAEWQPYVDGRIDVRDVPVVHGHLTGAVAVALIAPALSAELTD